MRLELRDRALENVKIFFQKTADEEICRMFPRSVTTLDRAIENYEKSLLPGANSYGKSLYVHGRYIGDVWCYGIERGADPEAMLSLCIFEKSFWGRGLGTEAVTRFIPEVCKRYGLKRIGAFCYSHNTASIRLLEKTGFVLEDTFVEDGVASHYFLHVCGG